MSRTPPDLWLRGGRALFPFLIAGGFSAATWQSSHLGHGAMALIAIVGSLGAWRADSTAALFRWQRAWPDLPFTGVVRFPIGDEGVKALCELCAAISPTARGLRDERPGDQEVRERRERVLKELDGLLVEGAGLCLHLDRLAATPASSEALRARQAQIHARLEAIGPATRRLHSALLRAVPIPQLDGASPVTRLVDLERDLSARLDCAEELEALRCLPR